MRMFGTNGIRGIANGCLGCEFALNVGRAAAAVLGAGRIAIAMDTRTSSSMLRSAVSSGIMSMGVDVVDLGMVPTPALQYYVKTHPDVTGGIMITASHNPPEFNGIKCISADGTECSRAEEERIEGQYEAGTEVCLWDGVGSLSYDGGAADAYVDAIVSKVDSDAVRAAGLRVCLDCANGASVNTSRMLLERLGVHADIINGTPDGMFPGHSSEPTEENLSELKARVVESGADLGIAHDGDADRCVFVTGSGRYVPGDKSLAILGGILARDGGEVVVTVATSAVVEDVVRSAGGRVVYTAVGSPIVARRMMVDGGVFGGEENGGMIFADHQYCRDGGMAAARMLEVVAGGRSLDDLVDSLPEYHTVKGAVMCSDHVKGMMTDVIAANHPSERIDRTDGIRIDYDDGWVLLRPSGTEPKYRIYSESKDPATAERRSSEFTEEFLREADRVGRDIQLRRSGEPFFNRPPYRCGMVSCDRVFLAIGTVGLLLMLASFVSYACNPLDWLTDLFAAGAVILAGAYVVQCLQGRKVRGAYAEAVLDEEENGFFIVLDEDYVPYDNPAFIEDLRGCERCPV